MENRGNKEDQAGSMSARSISGASALWTSKETNFSAQSKMSLSARSSRPANKENTPVNCSEHLSINGKDLILASGCGLNDIVVLMFLNDLEYLSCFSSGEEDLEKLERVF